MKICVLVCELLIFEPFASSFPSLQEAKRVFDASGIHWNSAKAQLLGSVAELRSAAENYYAVPWFWQMKYRNVLASDVFFLFLKSVRSDVSDVWKYVGGSFLDHI